MPKLAHPVVWLTIVVAFVVGVVVGVVLSSRKALGEAVESKAPHSSAGPMKNQSPRDSAMSAEGTHDLSDTLQRRKGQIVEKLWARYKQDSYQLEYLRNWTEEDAEFLEKTMTPGECETMREVFRELHARAVQNGRDGK